MADNERCNCCEQPIKGETRWTEEHEAICTDCALNLAAYEIKSCAAQLRGAVEALRDVAIPSLAYCEQKYGHDDQARLNCEATIARLASDEGER